jgi:hypothetical protein
VGRTTWLREHDRTQSVGDRPESVGDRPESVGDRPESVGDRPESVGDRPESAGNKPASAGCKPTSDGRDGLLCFQGDDTGDNISDQNCYFSELTGMYWVWKNVSSDVVGICHYRRYLLDHDGCLFTEASIAPVLANHDVITTKNLQLNFPYEEGFASHHKRIYLDTTAEVLRELYPEYDRTYKRLVHEKHTYFGNMLIMKKTLYDAYMEWLFAILFGVQKRVKVEEEDSYHRRIFGFVSEFLQYVWIVHNNLKVYECMVGMLGEKAEVTETKQRLAEYFAKGDFAGARQYFLAARKCRPDILMEASDVTGELHLCMEVIAIAGLEQEAYGTNLLQKNRDFMELMRYCNHLNRYAFQKRSGHIEHELAFWVQEQGVTEVALRVAEAVTGAMGQGEKMYSVI